ncbi:hypothetical protein FBALC1_08673 [Flavobacteriales bacterium ALC-1]|nr:hypothetical protein FBALC1_08673 [Flavobacteriales bacterium ALC-1]
MKTLKIISFFKVFALVAFFGAIGNTKSNSILGQKVEHAVSINNFAIDDYILGRTIRSHFGYLKLEISANTSTFSTDFYFNSNASRGLDPGYDAAIFGGNVPGFSIYSYLVENSDGTRFAIQTLSDTDMQNVTVPLGINASQGQEITFSVLETDIPDSIDVYLEDTFNNSLTLLNTNDYMFTASTNLTGSGRFFLRFQSNALSATEPIKDNLLIAYDKNEKAIIINGQLMSKTKIELYDLNGKVISSKSLDTSSTTQSIDVAHLSTGIYILKLISNTRKRVQKFIIS